MTVSSRHETTTTLKDAQGRQVSRQDKAEQTLTMKLAQQSNDATTRLQHHLQSAFGSLLLAGVNELPMPAKYTDDEDSIDCDWHTCWDEHLHAWALMAKKCFQAEGRSEWEAWVREKQEKNDERKAVERKAEQQKEKKKIILAAFTPRKKEKELNFDAGRLLKFVTTCDKILCAGEKANDHVYKIPLVIRAVAVIRRTLDLYVKALAIHQQKCGSTPNVMITKLQTLFPTSDMPTDTAFEVFSEFVREGAKEATTIATAIATTGATTGATTDANGENRFGRLFFELLGVQVTKRLHRDGAFMSLGSEFSPNLDFSQNPELVHDSFDKLSTSGLRKPKESALIRFNSGVSVVLPLCIVASLERFIGFTTFTNSNNASYLSNDALLSDLTENLAREATAMDPFESPRLLRHGVVVPTRLLTQSEFTSIESQSKTALEKQDCEERVRLHSIYCENKECE
jgi:hypothetical protein